MTHRLATKCAKNYCNRTLIVKVIVENVVTCFLGDTLYNNSPVAHVCVIKWWTAFTDLGPWTWLRPSGHWR